MRQQEGDESVSHRVMFVEPLSSGVSDGVHIWVKMPRAAVEEQLGTIPESSSIGDSESETYVTRSRRVTGGKRMEALGDMDSGAVEVEPLQFQCSLKVVVPGDVVGDSMTVGTVFDSGSGITCRPERLAHPCVKDWFIRV